MPQITVRESEEYVSQVEDEAKFGSLFVGFCVGFLVGAIAFGILI